MKRNLLIGLITFSIIYIIFPIRPEPIAQINQRAIFPIFGYIPILAIVLFALSCYFHKNPLWGLGIWRQKYLILALFLSIPLLIVLDIINAKYVLIGGTFLSLGLMFIMAILGAYVHGKDNLQSLLVGIMWSFCFMYIWEILYQLVIWFKSSCAIPGELAALLPSLALSLPFMWLLLIHKIKINKYLIIIASLFILVIIIWLLSGANTLIYYNNGWIVEPLDRIGYMLTRLSKVIAGLLIVGISFNSCKINVRKKEYV
jgi:hypothetical protein